jgi:hypothetical protein
MSQILHSLYGKNLGMDKDLYLTSPVGLKMPEVWIGPSGSEVRSDPHTVTSIGSTGTQLNAYGLNVLTTAAGSSGIFVLPAPVAGAQLSVYVSTGIATARLNVSATASETISAQTSSTYTSLNSTAGGYFVTLQAPSTARWAVKSVQGTLGAS